jgi:antimicrobial peptide system SdpB family protein
MNKITNIIKSNPITLARALLALGTLSTLLFTSVYDLFPKFYLANVLENKSGLMHLNYFLWFENVYIPYAISIIILLVVILGFYPRTMCFLHSITSYSVFYSMLIVEGGDQINIILTLLLIPICLLDNRKNGWIVKAKTGYSNSNSWFVINASFALIFIQIQMSILYFNAGVAKMYAPEWSNGTAVYYWFFDSLFGAPDLLRNTVGFLFKNPYSVSIINWSVIFLEVTLFIGIFLKQKSKYLLFLLGVCFHFLIILIHGLPSFFLSMIGGLILYLWNLELTINQNLKQLKNILKCKK